MKRRIFLTGITALMTTAFAGVAAFAATFAEDVVGQLAKQGFSSIKVESTWLGRLRIIGLREDGQREIILNPRTGEILRDTWLSAGKGAAKPIIDDIIDASSGQSRGGQDDGSGSNDAGSGSGGGDTSSGGGHSGSSSGSGNDSNSGHSDDKDGGSTGSNDGGSGKTDDGDRSGKDDKSDDKSDDKDDRKRDGKDDDKSN
ncbi:MAG: hypothetical protein WCS20_03925 [Alphaproteobacteria bacterium]